MKQITILKSHDSSSCGSAVDTISEGKINKSVLALLVYA